MATSVHLSIAVFRHPPASLQLYRHAALYLDFGDGRPSWKAHLIWTRASPSGLQIQTPWIGEAPILDDCRDFAKFISLGVLLIERGELLGILARVPVDKWDLGFSGHHWVERALRALRDRGYLPPDEYERGLEGMTQGIADGFAGHL